MDLIAFNKLDDKKKLEIIKQGTSNLVFLQTFKQTCIFGLILVVLSLFAIPHYKVWSASMEGKAEVAKMEIINEQRCN